MSNPNTESGFIDNPKPGEIPLELPPNMEQWALQHFQSFSAQYNTYSRSYRYTVDEAMRHSYDIAMSIYRDPLVYACIRARQMPTAQYSWHIEPREEGDIRQLDQVRDLTKILNDMPNFYQFRLSLLESIFFGKSGNQSRFKWMVGKNKKYLYVEQHKPINGDKIVFQYDGSVGLRVSTAYYKKSIVPTDLSTVHFLSPIERETVSICKFEPTDVDYFQGDMAGAINGFGLRGRIFLYWFVRQNMLSLLYSYLERVAAGFTIFYYKAGSPTSFQQVYNAAQTQIGQSTIMFPRFDDSNVPGVQRLEASTSGPSAFNNQVERMDELIQFVILGQTLTYDTASTGMGSGVAGAHERTFDRYLRADALMLQDSITSDLLSVLSKYNFPDLPIPRFVIDIDKPNVTEIVMAAQTLFQMGAPIDGDYLMSVAGLPKAEPGSNILSSQSMMSPVSMQATPQGVPSVGNSADVSDAAVDAAQQQLAGSQQGSTTPPNAVNGVLGKYSRDAIRNLLRYNKHLKEKGILKQAYEQYRGMTKV